MVDEHDPMDEDLGEFHFDESDTAAGDYGAAFGGGRSENKNLDDIKDQWVKKAIEHRKLLMIVGIAIVIFIVYKIIGVMFSPSDTDYPVEQGTNKVAEQTASFATPADTQQAVLPALDLTDAKPIDDQKKASQHQPFPAKVQSAIASGPDGESTQGMDRHTQALTQRVKVLTVAAQKMQQTITQMTHAIDGMKKHFNDQTQTLRHEVTKLRAEAKRHAEGKFSGKKKKITAYYVDAVIPGRAWLKSNRGAATTVIVGDYIPGYGVVVRIDPHQGVVMTNQDKIIGFNSQER